jgi:hypothetical protein
MKLIVLDLKLPFRHEADKKTKPNEDEAFLSSLEELRKDRHAQVAWAQLMRDHEADDLLFQSYHQNPDHPFKHDNPHLERGLTIQEGTPPAKPADEPPQSSGKSGLLVATVHYPKEDGKERSEEAIAKDSVDFLTRLEDITGKRFKDHCKAYGYKTVNARGQEYEDLAAIKHNSISVSISVSCTVSFGAAADDQPDPIF